MLGRVRRIDSIFARFATDSTPGCALAVKQNGSIVHERGYGMASLELGVPITPRTVFDVGSVSKQFTAASIMLLVIDGKLQLDDDVRKYLPELPSPGGSVTLRHLLTHTSGWRDYNDLLLLDGFDERDHTTTADAWATLKRQRALNFLPGTRYEYSNSGYFILGEVVARVSSQSLATFANERIFKPLGMSSTRFLDDTRRVVKGRATAYTGVGREFLVEMSNWDQVGDGALQTSVEDLAKWEGNFDAPTVGGPKLLDLLLTRGRLSDGMEIEYTAGLVRDSYRGVSRIQHSGAWAGYRAMIMRFPSEHVAILLTCNRADARTGSLAQGVADVMLTASPITPISSMYALSAKEGQRYTGLYLYTSTGAPFRTDVSHDTLAIVNGPQRAPLRATGPGEFRNAAGTVQYYFAGDSLVIASAVNAPETLVRATSGSNWTRKSAASYVGHYAAPDLALAFDVVTQDSTIALRPPRGSAVRLTQIALDTFTSDDFPAVRFIRDKSRRVVAMRFTYGRGIYDIRMNRQ